MHQHTPIHTTARDRSPLDGTDPATLWLLRVVAEYRLSRAARGRIDG